MSILKYLKSAGGRVSADSGSVRGTESEQVNDIGAAGEAASPAAPMGQQVSLTVEKGKVGQRS